jgi:tetratricopeptide (TPR) repeat protein
MSHLRAACTVLAVVAVARVASATPTPEDRKLAKHEYERAITHYNLGEFLPAAEAFRAVYKLIPEGSLLFNIAQAYRAGGDLKQSIFFYKSYLRANPSARERSEAEKRIADLQAKLDGTPVTPAAPAPPDMAAVAVAPPPRPEDKPAGDKPGSTVGSERLKPVVDLIKSKRPGFRACFDAWSKKNPGKGGKVVLTFFLDPDGGIQQADAEPTGFDAPPVAACIVDYAKTLSYPKSTQGKFTRFAYPFEFKPN